MIRAFWKSLGTQWAVAWSAVAGLYTAVVHWSGYVLDGIEVPITEAVLVVGAGLLLGLRLNLAYERWWEARTLWGSLVNTSRNLAVKIAAFAQPHETEAREMAAKIAGFSFALKDHLRDGVRLRDVPGFSDRDENPKHVPVWMVRRLYQILHEWRDAGQLRGHEFRAIDLEGRVLLDVCGACERIRNTPMPPSFATLTRLMIALAIFIMPSALIPRLEWWSVAAAAGFTFFFVVVESTATVIEHPFGTDSNQLDLDNLCAVIRDTTAEALLGPSAN